MALEVVIGAKVDSAVAGINQVKTSLDRIPQAANSAAASLNKFNTTVGTGGGSIQSLANSIKTGASQFTVLGEAGQRAGSQLRSLSGVLNTTASSIPPLTNAASQAGPSILQMGLAFGGAQLAGKLLGSVAVAVGEALFGSANAFSGAEVAAAAFGGTLRRLSTELAEFKSELDFSEKLSSIEAQLRGLSGIQLKLFESGQQGINAAQTIGKIDEQIDILVKSQNALLEGRRKFEETVNKAGKSSDLAKLLTTGIKIADITGPLLSQLNEGDRALVKQYQETNKTIEGLQKQRGDKSKEIAILARTQLLDIKNQLTEDDKKAVDEQKRINDQLAAADAKYISETIARGKQLASFFEGRRVVENFSIFDTKGETFNKAIKQIQDFTNGVMKIIPAARIPVEFNLPKPGELNSGGFFGELQNRKIDLSVPIKLIPTIPPAVLTDFEKDVQGLVEGINSAIAGIAVDSLANIGEAIGTALAGGDLGKVFEQFGSIIGSGLQTIGKQMIQIGVAALLAKKAFEKLFLMPGLAIVAGVALVAAGSALKSLLSKGVSGRASGGPVAAGQSYKVGEVGEEIFIPSSSGRIVPNNSMGMQGAAVPIINFNGEFAISGNELKLLLSRTDRYQNRNV